MKYALLVLGVIGIWSGASFLRQGVRVPNAAWNIAGLVALVFGTICIFGAGSGQ